MAPGEPPFSQAPSQGAAEFPRPFGSRYTLLKHLATGGMADVFLARQVGPAGFVKECVIKRILPHLARDRQFVSMFLDEARLCARLNHPNIAQVYDHGQQGDAYFIAMEYVDGVDLDRILEKAHERGEQRLPPEIAARIVCGIAEGLEHAHKAVDENGSPLGLVHRDVTPSNIVVSFEGVPKLLDFGIAKASSRENKTEVGIIKGKLPYMSPEQVQGEALDARSDVFSLGVLLYELTAGRKPFEGDNAAQLGMRILQEEPTPPTLTIPDYPAALEAIIVRAMAKRRDARTPSARALHLELERFLAAAGTLITAHDVAAYLGERFSRQPLSVAIGKLPTTLAAGGAVTERGDESDMTREKVEPRLTGQLEIGQAPVVDDMHAGRPQSRRSLGGGGGWLIGVAAVAVVAVGGGFFALRGWGHAREAATATVNATGESSTAGGARPAASPADTKTAPSNPAVASPAPAPAKDTAPSAELKPLAPAPSTKTAPPPAAPGAVPAPPAEAPTGPAARQAGPEAPPSSGAKKPAKPHHHRSSAPRQDASPRTLPKLPTLPVPEE